MGRLPQHLREIRDQGGKGKRRGDPGRREQDGDESGREGCRKQNTVNAFAGMSGILGLDRSRERDAKISFSSGHPPMVVVGNFTTAIVVQGDLHIGREWMRSGASMHERGLLLVILCIREVQKVGGRGR